MQLAPIKATGLPFDLTVTGTNTLVVHNVLAGDVFLCSGQSNMQKPVGLNPPQPPVDNYEQEIATAAKQARRELTTHTAGLAIALARQQINVDSNTDQVLVRAFASKLASHDQDHDKDGGKDGR